MKTKQLLLLSAISITVGLSSCKKDDPEPDTTAPPASTVYDNGVFVTNEGPFGSGTGTVSFISRSSSAVYNNIFEAKNSYPLGNIVQSMEIFNSKGYIVVNNAGKIEVVDGSSFASNGVITGFTYPRFFLGIDNSKAYVSEWGTGGVNGAIKVVDLNTKTITGTLTTGKGAEAMAMVGNKVYVACGGGFDNDSVVAIINSLTNTIDTTIIVGPNPSNLKVDAAGNVWVLCKGKWDATWSSLEQTGKLIKLNGITNAIDLSLTFSSTYSQPTNLTINGAKTTLYYTYNSKVYSHSIASSVLNTTETINRSFYGFAVDPTTDYFYGSDAADFVSNGKVIRYSPAAIAVDSFAVGVIPGNFCFK